MLQTEGPVPHVRRGQIAVHAHDGAGAGGAIDRGIVHRCVVPGRPGISEVQKILCGDVSGGDGAARYDARRRNTARAKGVVEGDERLPVHGLIDQPATAADHRGSFAVGIPGKSEAWREVLVVGIVEAWNLTGARLHLY